MTDNYSELGTGPTVFFSLSKVVPMSVEPSSMGSRNASIMKIIFPSLHLFGVRCAGGSGTQAVGDRCSYALKSTTELVSKENKGITGVSRSM